MRLFVLLPCYNEEEALPHLLKSMYQVLNGRSIDYEVIVINDGSSDNTEGAARQYEDILNLKVINHEKNMGLGEAVNTGLSYFYSIANDDDVAVIMDADNTHNPELIPLMLEKISLGSDVVIASRYEYGGREVGLSNFRRLCSSGACALLWMFFHIPDVRDYTCGYRAYSGKAIKKAYNIYGSNFIEEKGFTCMAEIIIKLHYIGFKISEVPLILRYDLKKGKSKMKVMNTIKRYFLLISNIRHYRNVLSLEPILIHGKEK